MGAEEYLVAALGLVMCVVCGILAVTAYRRTGELLSPWIVFLGMAAFDIYLPGALYFSIGLPEQAPWILPSSRYMVAPALLVFTIGLAIFCWGYSITGGCAKASRVDSVPDHPLRPRGKPYLWRTYLVLAVSGLLYIWKMKEEISKFESFDAYVSRVLTKPSAETATVLASGLSTLLYQITGAMLPVALMTIGILFSERKRSSPFGGLVWPAVGLLAAMSTLSRGTVLSYFMALALLETARVKHNERRAESGDARHASRQFRRRVVGLLFVGVAVFFSYGSIRNFFSLRAWGEEYSIGMGVQIELQRWVRGEGLVGLASVLDYYPREKDFLEGKTILDMLLLPVPRSIWPDKPAWYGVDDITRGMGWPTTTGSAVTMPGELYVNFGYTGVPLMLVYGAIFGLFHRYRHGKRFRFLYAFILVPMMMPTFWMSFTGFMNQLVPTTLVIPALWFIFPRSVQAEKSQLVLLPTQT